MNAITFFKANVLSPAFALILILSSCSERRPIGRAADAKYLEDGSNKGLVNLGKINAQDFTRAANQLIGDLLSSGALAQAPSQPAMLHLVEHKPSLLIWEPLLWQDGSGHGLHLSLIHI